MLIKTGQVFQCKSQEEDAPVGVFIPERSALKGLTGQFLPQHWNRKEWVRFLCSGGIDFFNSFILELKKLAGYEVSKTNCCPHMSYP